MVYECVDNSIGEDDDLTYELPTFVGEPSNHGQGWSVVQKNELVHRVLEQEPLETVCRDLGRSAQSVRLKLLQVKSEDGQPFDEEVAEYLAKFPVEEAEYRDWISVEDDVLEAGLSADLSAEELVAHIGRPADDIRQRIEGLADAEASKQDPQPELSEDELWEEVLDHDSLAQLSDRLGEAPEPTRQKLVTLKVRRDEFFNSQLTSLFRDALQMQLETSEWTDAEKKLLEEGERVGLSARAWSMHLGRSPDEIRERLSEAEDRDDPTPEERSGDDEEPEEADQEKEPTTIGDWSGGEEGALYGAVGQNKTTISEICGRFRRSAGEVRLKLLELKCRRGKHLDDDLSEFLLEFPGSDHVPEEWRHWEDEVLKVAVTRGREISEIVPHIGRTKSEIAARVEQLDNIDDHRLDELTEEPPDDEPARESVEGAYELDNVGEPWTEEEEKQLFEKATDGMALRELQGIFQRHIETIRKKLIARKVADEAYFDERLTHVFEKTAELQCATEKWKKAEEDLLKRGIESGVVLDELVHHLGRSKRDIYYRASDWSAIEVRNLKNWIIDNSIFDEESEVDTSEPVSEGSEEVGSSSAQEQTYDPEKSLRSLVAEILSDAQVPLERDDVVERLPEGLSYSKTTVRTYLSSEDYSIRVGRGEYFHQENYPVREFQQRKLVNFVVEHLLTDGKTMSCVQLVEPLKESELSSPRAFAEHDHAPKLLWGLLAEDDRVRTGPHLLARKGDGNTEDLIQPAIYEALKKVGPATPAEVDAEIDKRFGFDYPDDRVESALRDLATKGDAERLPNGLYYPINVEKAVFNLFQSKSRRILECALQTSPEKFTDHQLWLVAKTLKETGNGVQARRFVEELEARDSEYTERPDWEEVHNVVPDEDLSEVSDSLVDDLLGAAD
jgi:transposase